MNLTIKNASSVAVPVMSHPDGDDGGWCEVLAPQQVTVIVKRSDNWIIGEKPDFLDTLREAAGTLYITVNRVLMFWKSKQREMDRDRLQRPIVRVTLSNFGEFGVKVILGDPTRTKHLGAGGLLDVEAENYIELQEEGARPS